MPLGQRAPPVIEFLLCMCALRVRPRTQSISICRARRHVKRRAVVDFDAPYQACSKAFSQLICIRGGW